MELFSILIQSFTAIAIVFAAWQLLFHSRQMHREFEHLYVARYWELMDQRSARFSCGGRPKKSDRRVVRGYLQLCEDQIDLRRLARITDNTWGFWCGAILDQVVEEAYALELHAVDGAELPNLRELIRSGGADPLAQRWTGRKLHGL